MTLSITYSLVTLTIDDVTSFLRLIDIHNVRKNTHFSPHKSYGKFLFSVQDSRIIIDSEGFVHILNLFVC